MSDAGITAVPAPIAVDTEAAILVQEWLEGVPVETPSNADVEQACGFLESIFLLSSAAGAARFSAASEACLSGKALEQQVRQRRESFAPHPALDGFLVDIFDPAMADAMGRAHAFGGFSSDLPRHLRRLIAADFGFHNALRGADGRLRFFDFDYFGWDDPIKQVADFIFHPETRLSSAQKDAVIARIGSAFAEDDAFSPRLQHFGPLFVLRWALIVLNPFRRDRASTSGPPGEELANARIATARRLVDRTGAMPD